MTTAAKPARRRTARKTSATANPYAVMVYRLAMAGMFLAALIVLHS
jgi:hypothetical protein